MVYLIKRATWLITMLVWAGVGMFVWIPALFGVSLLYFFGVLTAAFASDRALLRKSTRLLDKAATIYSDGFSRVHEAIFSQQELEEEPPKEKSSWKSALRLVAVSTLGLLAASSFWFTAFQVGAFVADRYSSRSFLASQAPTAIPEAKEKPQVSNRSDLDADTKAEPSAPARGIPTASSISKDPAKQTAPKDGKSTRNSGDRDSRPKPQASRVKSHREATPRNAEPLRPMPSPTESPNRELALPSAPQSPVKAATAHLESATRADEDMPSAEAKRKAPSETKARLVSTSKAQTARSSEAEIVKPAPDVKLAPEASRRPGTPPGPTSQEALGQPDLNLPPKATPIGRKRKKTETSANRLSGEAYKPTYESPGAARPSESSIESLEPLMMTEPGISKHRLDEVSIYYVDRGKNYKLARHVSKYLKAKGFNPSLKAFNRSKNIHFVPDEVAITYHSLLPSERKQREIATEALRKAFAKIDLPNRDIRKIQYAPSVKEAGFPAPLIIAIALQ